MRRGLGDKLSWGAFAVTTDSWALSLDPSAFMRRDCSVLPHATSSSHCLQPVYLLVTTPYLVASKRVVQIIRISP